MKKFISLLTGMALLIGTVIPISYAVETSWSSMERPSGTVRMGVIGDLQLTPDNMASDTYLENALNAFDTIDSDMDAILLNGDIVNALYANPQSSEDVFWDSIRSVYNFVWDKIDATNLVNAEVVWTMGSCEHYDNAEETAKNIFVEKTNNDVTNTSPNEVMKIGGSGGYTVIKVAAEGKDGKLSQDTETWLKNEIEEATIIDETKPVFVMMHSAVYNTIGGQVSSDDEKNVSDEFRDYLNTKPQVIFLSGLLQHAAQNPNTIWQDGFTVIETPLLGHDAPRISGVAADEYNIISQALMIDIEGSVVKVYRMDLNNNEYIGDPWVIDVTKPNEFKYTDERKTNSNAPAFGENATVTISETDTLGAKISFPRAENVAQPDIQDGFTLYYKANVKNADGNIVKTQTIRSNYHTVANTADMPMVLNADITGLEGGTTYTIEVIPVAPFGKEGTAIVSESFAIPISGHITNDGTPTVVNAATDYIRRSADRTNTGNDGTKPGDSGQFVGQPTNMGGKSYPCMQNDYNSGNYYYKGTWFEFEVSTDEEGWYDLDIDASSNSGVGNKGYLTVAVNCELVNDCIVEKTGGHGTGFVQTFNCSMNEGNIWLPKGKSVIRIRNTNNASGVGTYVTLYNLTLKKSDYNAAVSDVHNFNFMDYSSCYDENFSDGESIRMSNHRIDYQASNPNLRYEIAVPKSGWYKLSADACRPIDSDSIFDVVVNSKESSKVSFAVRNTGAAWTNAKTFEASGNIYMNKGINTIRFARNGARGASLLTFKLELVEAAVVSESKIELNAAYVDKIHDGGNSGKEYPTLYNGILNYAAPSNRTEIKYTVNVAQEGWYNLILNMASGSAANVKCELNGVPQSNLRYAKATKFDTDALKTLDEQVVGKIYLKTGGNSLIFTAPETTCAIGSVIIAKPEAKLTQNGAEITAEQLVSGTVTATIKPNGFNVNQLTGAETNCYAAIYDGGRLVGIGMVKKPATSYAVGLDNTLYDEITVEIDGFTAQPGKSYTIKAFIWDNNQCGESFNF